MNNEEGTVRARNRNILARQDRIPVWPHGTSLLWVLGAGYFFAFFDIINIGAALPEIARQFGISTSLASWAVTASLLAYIVGSYVDGLISDRWGRRISLILSVAFFTVGSIGAAFSYSIGWLIFWRVIAGMGIGAEIASITTYLSEVSPSAVRGRYTSWANVFAYAGFAFVPLLARALVPTFEWGWRVLFLIGALGGLTILYMRRGLKETPRWLLENGWGSQAAVQVEQSEQRARAITGKELPAVEETEDDSGKKDFSTLSLLKPPWLNRVILLCVIWFIYYIGNYGWLEMAPTLLHRLGYSMTESLSFLVVTGIGFLAGALLSVRYNDRFERKYSLVVISLVWSACLFIIGFWPEPWVIMVAGFILSTTIGLLVPILYTLTAEHFSTRARTTGFALSVGVGHIGGAIAPMLLLWVAGFAGFVGALSTMAITGLIVAALVPFTLSMTGSSLERASKEAS